MVERWVFVCMTLEPMLRIAQCGIGLGKGDESFLGITYFAEIIEEYAQHSGRLLKTTWFDPKMC